MKTLESILSPNMDSDISLPHMTYTCPGTGELHIEQHRKKDTIYLEPGTHTVTLEAEWDMLTNFYVLGVSEISECTFRVVDANHIFENQDIRRADLTGMDMSKCTTMFNMFNASGIEHVDLTGLDMRNVELTSNAFCNCQGLKDTDDIRGLDKLDFPKLVFMNGMFADCKNLKNAGLPNLVNNHNYKKSSLSAYSMFQDCKNLKKAIIPGVGSASSLQNMFEGCENLEKVDITAFNGYESKDHDETWLLHVFSGCDRLKKVRLNKFMYSAILLDPEPAGLSIGQVNKIKWEIV